MSQWYDIKKGDIDFSLNGEDLHIYLGSDDSGAIYASISLSILNDILKLKPKIKKKKFYQPTDK